MAQTYTEFRLFPTSPSKTWRYNTTDKITTPNSVQHPTPFPRGRPKITNPGLKGIVYRLAVLPQDWVEYVHPEGKPYFRNAKDNAVTDSDITETLTRKKIEYASNFLFRGLSDVVDVELYLALDPHRQDTCHYYFVDHATQRVFWPADVDLLQYELIPRELKDTSYDLFISRQYYRHLEFFPCHIKVPLDAASFLHDVLVFTCTDHLTGTPGSSATPWNAEKTKMLLELLEKVEEKKDDQHCETSYRTWFVARLVHEILDSRLLHRHGLFDACIDRSKNIRHSPLSKVDLILGVPTLLVHLTFLHRLECLTTPNISSNSWQAFVGSLLAEWADSNLLATVVLSANMAFLALGSVTWPAVICSTVSTSCSIGSIVIGVHHVWTHRKYCLEVVPTEYFSKAIRWTGTLKPLAFFLSLPMILFLWSLISFAASIALHSFDIQRPKFSYGISGVFFGVVFGLVVATLFFFYPAFRLSRS